MRGSYSRFVFLVSVAILSGLLYFGCAEFEDDIIASNDPATLGDSLQQLLDERVQEMQIPGSILRVETPSGEVWTVTSGIQQASTLENVEADGWTGTPIATDQLYTRIGSLTKSFTATLVCMLVDEGLVSLDSTVAYYLSGFQPEIPNADIITVRQLLNMTAGLTNYTDVEAFYMNLPPPYYTPAELVEMCLDGGGTDFEPGEGWTYSNTNYVVAGLIAEAVTGDEYYELVENMIMRPLGMIQSSMPAPQDNFLPGPYWHGYSWDMPDGSLYDWTYQDPSWAWSAGMAVSTVHDIAIWIQAVHRGTLLSPEMHGEMYSWVDLGVPTVGYGLGISRFMTDSGYFMYGHNGSMPGYETAAYVIEGYTITVINNGRPKAEWGFAHSGDEIVLSVIDLLFSETSSTIASQGKMDTQDNRMIGWERMCK